MATQPVNAAKTFDLGQPADWMEEAGYISWYTLSGTHYVPKNAQPLYANALPEPPPPGAVFVLANDGCEYCKTFLAATNYPTETPEGRPIIYINMNSASGVEYAKKRGLSVYGIGMVNVASEQLMLNGKPMLMSDGKTPVPNKIFPVLLSANEQGEITHAMTAGVKQSVNYMNQPVSAEMQAQKAERLAQQAEQRRAIEISKRLFALFPLSEANQKTLFQAPIPPMESIGANDSVLVVSSTCGHCQMFAARASYQTKDEQGNRIIYVDLDTPQGRAFQEKYFPKVEYTPSLYRRDDKGEWQLAPANQDPLKLLFPVRHQIQGEIYRAIEAQVDKEMPRAAAPAPAKPDIKPVAINAPQAPLPPKPATGDKTAAVAAGA